MSKQKLFLDFDSTIVDSVQAICQVYNILYKDHPQFTPARWYNLNDWAMKSTCPLVNNINELFSNELFFKYVTFMQSNTKEIIERLCEKYNVIIPTIGTARNLSYKAIWLENNLSCVTNYILMRNENCTMDKSIVDMRDGIIIDDNSKNLLTSNASYKYVFGDEYEWNKDGEFKRLWNWTDIENLLLGDKKICNI